MTDKNSSEGRRKLLKSIAAGSGAVIAGKNLPENWMRPVVDSVVLPAHAQATGPTYEIVCSAFVVSNGSQCAPEAISFFVSGEVSASDGSSLTGVSLTVSYTNEMISPPPPDATITQTVLVGAGNTFSSGEITATPPAGEFWHDPVGTVAIRFTDTATYGTSTCNTEFSCREMMPVCGCLLSNLAVNSRTNTFSATYTWSNCSNIAETRMIITGPGVIDPLGYVQPTSNASGSRDFVAVGPYNATDFQLGQTYTFTVTVEDAGSNVLQTCIDTVIATP
jgi:hypothetical protein